MADSSPALGRQPSFGAWLGVVLLCLFFGLFVAVLIGLSPRGNDYEAKRAKVREEKLKTLREEADKELHSYSWVDKSKGVARIPIERAMELTLADLSQKKPASAGPIETPSPAATGAPAPSPSVTAPAASATPKANAVSGPTSEMHGQPDAAAAPPAASPGTQPNASATPAATAAPASALPAVSPSAGPTQAPAGTSIPVAGATPTPP